MMASMILLIATSSMMSCAKRLAINPSMVPLTGHMMPARGNFPPVQMSAIIPALGKNDEGTKAWLAQLDKGGQNVIMPEKTLEQAALEEYLDGGANEASVMKQVRKAREEQRAARTAKSDL